MSSEQSETSTIDLGRLFCDVVLKGGITSGVVYPALIARLAVGPTAPEPSQPGEGYRLRNIGGASAGAIAAAAAAAAEYRRQTDPANPSAGFQRLAGLGQELQADPTGATPPRQTRLFSLCTPTPLAAPLFKVLAGMLNKGSWPARVLYGLGGLLMAFPGWSALGAICCLAVIGTGASLLRVSLPDSPWGVAALIAAAIVAFVVGLFGAIVATLMTTLIALKGHVAEVMRTQDYGLCTGMNVATPLPALTQWLHSVFQEVAYPQGGPPVTFGQLEAVEFRDSGLPADLKTAPAARRTGISLRVMTTCLTLGRPFTLPSFDDEEMFFREDEFKRLFPEAVVSAMMPAAQDPTPTVWTDPTTGEKHPLVAMPTPDKLPLIVAVRMSLSFPLLFSAVPLYRRDETGNAQRLLFTDGGVCSNLPVHLFDAPLSTWPTFGINLRNDLTDPAAQRVVTPKRGQSYPYEGYSIDPTGFLGGTAAFFSALIDTMQNWHDSVQRAAPGTRERVFTIRHTKQEGGLNLNMPVDAIEQMVKSGRLTAEAIDNTFRPHLQNPEDDWHYHRWVRLRVLLPVLHQFLVQLELDPTRADAIIQQLLAADSAFGGTSPLTPQDKRNADELLGELRKTSLRFSGRANFAATAPKPAGSLRVTPKF